VGVAVWPMAGNKGPRGRSIPLPAPGGEWKEKGKNSWVGIRAV